MVDYVIDKWHVVNFIGTDMKLMTYCLYCPDLIKLIKNEIDNDTI